MNDDDLRHLCKLGTIAVSGLRDRDDWMEYIWEADRIELKNYHTCLTILSKAFVELMNRANMKPTFQIPAEAARPQDGGGA